MIDYTSRKESDIVKYEKFKSQEVVKKLCFN